MRRHCFLALLLALAFASGCARSTQDAVMDPYRPAMQPRAQSHLDELHHLPRYDISVRIDPAAHRQVTGQEKVWVPHRGPDELEELYFRLYPNLPRLGGGMGINGVAVNGQTAPFVYEAEKTALRINLPEPLLPGDGMSVELGWDLQVPRRESGYVLCGDSQSIISLPLFYPVLAVRDDGPDGHGWNLDIAPPTYGDPAFVEVGLYEVTATVPSEMVVAGTGTIVTTTARAPGWSDVRFAGGPRREFMLILSSQFQTSSVEACGALVTSYYLPEDGATGLAALQYAAAALRVYCDHFDPYPFQDMAVVSAPLVYFGMEYPGLNLIGVDLYRGARKELEFLVAHEVAHQWWYSAVGNDPVNFAWLDEGLAEYSTYTYYAARYGQPEAEAKAERRWRIPYRYAVDEGLDTVLDQPLSAFLPSNYETMAYAKGALFFDALRREVEDEAYYRALREYLDRYRYSIATPADLLAVAEEVSGHDLGELYREWVLTARGAGEKK